MPFAAALSRQQLESIAEHKRQDIIVEDSPKSPARGIVVEKAEEKEAFDRAVAEGTVASSVFPAASQRGMDSSAEIAALWPTADAAKDEGAADDSTKASDDGSKRKKKKKPKVIQEEGGEETKKKRRDRAGRPRAFKISSRANRFPPLDGGPDEMTARRRRKKKKKVGDDDSAEPTKKKKKSRSPRESTKVSTEKAAPDVPPTPQSVSSSVPADEPPAAKDGDCVVM